MLGLALRHLRVASQVQENVDSRAAANARRVRARNCAPGAAIRWTARRDPLGRRIVAPRRRGRAAELGHERVSTPRADSGWVCNTYGRGGKRGTWEMVSGARKPTEAAAKQSALAECVARRDRLLNPRLLAGMKAGYRVAFLLSWPMGTKAQAPCPVVARSRKSVRPVIGHHKGEFNCALGLRVCTGASPDCVGNRSRHAIATSSAKRKMVWVKPSNPPPSARRLMSS